MKSFFVCLVWFVIIFPAETKEGECIRLGSREAGLEMAGE